MKRHCTLYPKDEVTLLLKDKDLKTWDDLIAFISYLPFGRNANRYDRSLIITECKGTCSSKHVLLKHETYLFLTPNVTLILGLNEMTPVNP